MLASVLRALPPRDATCAAAPAFAQAVAWAPLEEPFREGIAAVCRAPGEVVLYAQLPATPELASVPLHWEIARDAAMQLRERYGLRATRPGETVQIALHALEKGRPYWFRLWAGGHWSHTGHFHSGARSRPDLSLRTLRPRRERPALSDGVPA